jgi:hypothetical protein
LSFFLFSDPEVWQTKDVGNWLNFLEKKFDLKKKLDARKFPKTGKELCELTG